MSGAIQRAAEAQSFFTTDQLQMIRTSFLSGASEQEAGVLLELARLRRLNPITRQIHFVKRWDGQKRCEVWAAQVGIDGFRAIAERTGLYDGQDEAEFEYDAKGGLKLARVRVYRKDWSRPAVGVAHYAEYVQLTKDGKPTHMWGSKVHVMLGKCAEAIALRKAFPEDTSGLYSPEEMPEAEAPRTVAPPPPAVVAPVPEHSKPKREQGPKAKAAPRVVEAEVVQLNPAIATAKEKVMAALGWSPEPQHEEPPAPELEPVDLEVVDDLSPAEKVLARIAEAQTLADLAPVVKSITEHGLTKDAGIRQAYQAKQRDLRQAGGR
jgi:phage recombination protein Bet